MKLELQLDEETVAPGGQLSGRVVVLEGGDARKLTLTARFLERSPTFLVPIYESGAVLEEGPLEAGASVDFGVQIPEGAKPGVKGKNGELYWELEAAADKAGLDISATRRFEVTAGDA